MRAQRSLSLCLYVSLSVSVCLSVSLSPVPVIELDVDSQLLQGDAWVGPEGDLPHLPDQLAQLALELLHDGHVVRVLTVALLQLLQVVITRLV